MATEVWLAWTAGVLGGLWCPLPRGGLGVEGLVGQPMAQWPITLQ